MLTNLPVPYDFCVGDPISRPLTVGSTPVYNSVLNVKTLVGAFNQEKALVGAFSVIVKTGCGTDGSFYSTTAAGSQRLPSNHGDISVSAEHRCTEIYRYLLQPSTEFFTRYLVMEESATLLGLGREINQ